MSCEEYFEGFADPLSEISFALKRVNRKCLLPASHLIFSSPSAADPSGGYKVKRSLPARQLLVGYWGQNSIGRNVSRQYWEKDLRYFCSNHKFDIYLVAFVHRLFRNNQNRGTAMNHVRV